MRNPPPHRLMCLNIWPQLVMLFGEVYVSLGGKVFLEKVCHWGQGCFFLSASCLRRKCEQSASCSCCHASPTVMDCRPCGTVSHNKPFLPKVGFMGILYHSHGKLTKAVAHTLNLAVLVTFGILPIVRLHYSYLTRIV